VADELRIAIESDDDVVTARGEGRALAGRLGFSNTDLTVIATAISEIARNIVHYANRGEIEMRLLREPMRAGIEVVARDDGPGIDDIGLALRDGFSSRDGLGLGLPGTRRLMDDFRVESEPGRGTTVTMAKWVAGGG
jgi:serine/threonine-protein kinase RsbT